MYPILPTRIFSALTVLPRILSVQAVPLITKFTFK
jgi:hypothetical protein